MTDFSIYVDETTEDVRDGDESIGYAELTIGATTLQYHGPNDGDYFDFERCKVVTSIYDFDEDATSPIYKRAEEIDEDTAVQIIEAEGGAWDYVEPNP